MKTVLWHTLDLDETYQELKSQPERFYRQRAWQEPGLPQGGFAALYDDAFLSRFVRVGDGGSELTFVLEGLRCASCVWLNEKILGGLDGVISARVNYGTHRAQVRFDPARITPARLFAAITDLGYLPRPFTADAVHRLQERERRSLLIRLGNAIFLSMQLMGYSLALYAGYFQGMEAGTKQLLHWFAAAVATPVVFYSGWPLLAGAWRSLRTRRQHGPAHRHRRRHGGYLPILKCGFRKGDNAPMALVELLDRPEVPAPAAETPKE